jgi:decaprenylphospho-beta-D-ribofuranose 2-oxidase
VTVGGAIAADIHGKNHHADGSFGAHVHSLVLAAPDGTTRRLTPTGTPEAFWATCGGMGLTGTILEATVALKRIETSRLAVDTDRVGDLDDLLVRLRDGQDRYRYSVAWIDLLAKGRHLGRSVLTQGDFARREELARDVADPLAFAPRRPLPAPHAPGGLLNRFTIAAFNELWFRKAPAHRVGELQTIAQFFHPLDLADGWNRLYGGRGFVQWQCLLPFGAEDALRRCVEDLSGERAASFLAVLKTMGPADPGPLSFPGPGWTLAVDLPAGDLGTAALLDRLDEVVVDAGGRLYLAKDGRCRPELVPRMYPRLDEWRATCAELDPDGHLVSDLARRLHLRG